MIREKEYYVDYNTEKQVFDINVNGLSEPIVVDLDWFISYLASSNSEFFTNIVKNHKQAEIEKLSMAAARLGMDLVEAREAK